MKIKIKYIGVYYNISNSNDLHLLHINKTILQCVKTKNFQMIKNIYFNLSITVSL
jgi:hypothetical protein